MTHADGGKVKRYDCGRSFGGYVEAGEFESPDGAYVHYSSYARLEQQVEQLQGENARMTVDIAAANHRAEQAEAQIEYTRDERDTNYRLLVEATARVKWLEEGIRKFGMNDLFVNDVEASEYADWLAAEPREEG